MTLPDATASAAGRLRGIHAATVCPLRFDLTVDETALAAHVERVARTRGIEGLLINGHAGENFLLSREEKKRIIAVVREAVGAGTFLTSGINAEASLEAAQHARDAEEAGADAILLFPPNSWALGLEEAAVIEHHRHVLDACGLPLLLYQAPVGAGAMAYPVRLLEQLVPQPRVIGIKEGSWEVAAYEENRRAVRALRPDIAVLGSGDEHLLTCYLVGSEGSQVSLAAIVPDAIAALWRAASQGDWVKARAWHDVIYPLAVAIYRHPPASHATARLKACLHIMGLIPNAAMRPPAQAAGLEEYRMLERAIARVVLPGGSGGRA